jgi:RNA polymerase primary sigma factor
MVREVIAYQADKTGSDGSFDSRASDLDRDLSSFGVSLVGFLEEFNEVGVVTSDDLEMAFPGTINDPSKLTVVSNALGDAGLEYVDLKQGVDVSEEELDKQEEVSMIDDNELERLILNAIGTDSLGLYILEAGRTPLLTAEEEIELAKLIEKGRKVRERMTIGGEIEDDDKALLEQGKDAMDHLLLANTRLVISVAKKHTGRGVPFLDLIQEGNIGLIRGAKKFDYHKGHKFSTYVTWWIRQAITRAIADGGRTIRLPVHLGDQIYQLSKVQQRLAHVLGREPTVVELAEDLDITEKKVNFLLKVQIRPLSLEEPKGENGDSVLGDFIPDDVDVAELTMQQLLREKLDNALKELPEREAMVLRLRFGLDDNEYTLKDVGVKLGVTRERARQIEAKALGKLRHPDVKRELEGFTDSPEANMGDKQRDSDTIINWKIFQAMRQPQVVQNLVLGKIEKEIGESELLRRMKAISKE